MDISPPFEATKELLALLPLLNRIVATEVRREVGEDTSMPQFRVLTLLAAQPLTLSTLAKQRRVSPQSMSELVQVLVERGWIARLPDPSDRRQSLLQLTEHGRAQYERATDHMLQRLTPLIGQLSRAELAAVRIALPALHRVLTQEDDDAKDEH
ncbi:MAG: MarR family transcriptional regulator [Roseiflexaceae bacterium]|mgnify:CR=1 FL=1|nr:MarR family transcriptional regulator [Roseiflexaceae bacterium]